MEADYDIHELGGAGLEFVRRHLRDANRFCDELLKVVESDRGNCFTLAPQGLPAKRLLEFDAGGIFGSDYRILLPDGSRLQPVRSAIDFQVSLLRRALGDTPEGVCIIDDNNLRWAEVDLTRYPHAAKLGNDVYHLVHNDAANGDLVNAVASGNTIWHGVAAACSRRLQLEPERIISIDELDATAASAKLITCAAYDGEGFVAWRRM